MGLLLFGILVVWMLACAACGFTRRYLRFLSVLLAGLALNLSWMVFGLQAHPFEVNVLMALTAALIYGVCAFFIGGFAGRIARAWRDSRVSDPLG
ncbi:hypothetical protein Z945_2484 [Sulfitobacter noctilucae]|uniref:hypothetical protein n=1 Tax=Sulfitobacter noctilucae TaxID=1342302 RepID=UPI00046B00DC|nr:hypothetical protein [Sulfitobacter noctilucae]KIN61492.1 hypothetical protein Z945_2484 [Sulfitobacter noctilucae]